MMLVSAGGPMRGGRNGEAAPEVFSGFEVLTLGCLDNQLDEAASNYGISK